MVLLVLLHLGVNIGQSWQDFSVLNELTARRLDTLAATLALHIEDHTRVVDLTTVAVGDAVETSTLDNYKFAQLASLDKELLGSVSTSVPDPNGRLLAVSDPVIERYVTDFVASPRSMHVERLPYAQPALSADILQPDAFRRRHWRDSTHTGGLSTLFVLLGERL